MNTPSKEEALAILQKRSEEDTELAFTLADQEYNALLKFLTENQGLQGSPDYDKARTKFGEVATRRAKMFADMEAQAVDDPSMQAKLDALGRGFFQGPAQFLDLGVSAVGAGLRAVTPEGTIPENPYNFSMALQDLGLGYYDAERARLPENIASDPRPRSQVTGNPLMTLSDMPASTRPFAAGGEEAGLVSSMTLPIAMAAKGKTAVQLATPGRGAKPLNLGQRNFRGKNLLQENLTTDLKGVVGGTVDDMVRFAAKNPLTFASLEGSVAVLSGLGGGVSEAIAPGDPTARMIGAVGAPLSVMSVPLLAGKSYQIINGMTGDGIANLKRAIGMKLSGRRGAEKESAKLLQAKLRDLGSDPEKVAKFLDDIYKNPNSPFKDIDKSPFSPGLLTGDKGLLAIERSLIKSDGEISKNAAEQTRKSIIAMNKLFRNSLQIAEGDPEVLRVIAETRMKQLNAVTGLRVTEALRKLQNMEANLTALGTANPQVTKEQAGKQIKNIFDATYGDLKKTESALWDKVDKTLRSSGTETDGALQKLASEEGGLLEIDLPNVLKRMQNLEFKPEAGISSVSSGDLLAARSQISEQIRKALAGSGDSQSRDLARRLFILETGILNDLNAAGGGVQLMLANNATRNRYEFLGIPIISKMYRRNIQGILEQQPDVVLDKALMGRGQATFQDFSGLLKAGEKGRFSQDMTDPLAKFYYAMANDTVSATGEVDLTKLSGFLQKHENGLRALGIYDSLQKPEIQAHLVKRLQNSATEMKKSFQGKSMLGKIIDVPATGMPKFMEGIFASPDRYKELRQLRNLSLKKAKGVNNQDAFDGIRSSILEVLFKNSQKAVGKGGVVDEPGFLLFGEKLRNQLDVKVRKTTLREDLINSGLFTKDEMAGIDAMSKRADEFSKSVAARTEGEVIEGIPPGSDALVDVIARLGGASIAAASPLADQIGHQLIIAYIGSQAGRQFLNKMPTLKLQEILVEASKDPVFMKKLLEMRVGRDVSPMSQNLELGALLASKAIIGERELYEIEENDFGVTNLLKDKILSLAGEGKNNLEIMEAFEVEARTNPNTKIGPYKLDQVQALLNLSDEGRAQVARKVNVRNVPKGRRRAAYYLSRKPRN
tara:strand:+ start:630 stop:3968 length:3339 start_codon:yes stop_codon:yes gene_type:complete